ncbi:hypothetical protein TNCV_2675521 [Trichonephila clavipes]|nr:hypothetical protein TNCV_2675521 [Trichonephila clavipes]
MTITCLEAHRPAVRSGIYCREGVTVWGAISWDTRSSLVVLQTLTARRYVDDILTPIVLPISSRPGAIFNRIIKRDSPNNVFKDNHGLPDSDDEIETNNAAPDSTSSEMRKVVKTQFYSSCCSGKHLNHLRSPPELIVQPTHIPVPVRSLTAYATYSVNTSVLDRYRGGAGLDAPNG